MEEAEELEIGTSWSVSASGFSEVYTGRWRFPFFCLIFGGALDSAKMFGASSSLSGVFLVTECCISPLASGSSLNRGSGGGGMFLVVLGLVGMVARQQVWCFWGVVWCSEARWQRENR